jgi:hypothetical protein
MATNSNVFSQGGGGGTFENEVQTVFFISFFLGLYVPGTNGHIEKYRLQSGSLGYKTDDLLLNIIADGQPSKALIQIKHDLIISPKGQEFSEVICDAWRDFSNNELFDPANDRIFIIKHALTKDERNHLKVVLDWARAKSDHQDFFNEVTRIKGKDHYLKIFQGILKAEFDKEVDDLSLFRFLRTLYFFEFDLSTDNSLVKGGCLSLIKRFKVNENISAVQVWDSCKDIVSTLNSKGGQMVKADIPTKLTSAIHQDQAQSALRNLKLLSQQQLETVDMIADQIGTFKLQRTDHLLSLTEMQNANQVVIISGDPGCGKSAFAKAHIQRIKQNTDGYILCFSADELGQGHLYDQFKKEGINLTLNETFGFFAAFQNNLIYIDAAEKLLEANGTPLTELLLAVRSLSNVHVLISCRSSSLGLIEFKYFSAAVAAKFPLGPLSEEDLAQVSLALPPLAKLMRNVKLKRLLSYPKYLDFAYRALLHNQNDLEDIDEEKFRDYLWLIVIENQLSEYHNGLPERRGQVFTDIAVARSRQMRQFASIESTDHEAIDKLLKDNVIISKGTQKLYAPAHDVLDDWALLRFVNHLYGKQLSADSFFNTLGNEPAMRRAYRLWVQSSLNAASEGPLDFAANYLFETADSNFWNDESLIGILYSERCHVFFERFEEKLKKDNFNAFFRLIQVMRTACRENVGDFYNKSYVPRGYGWQSVFKIIRTNINLIDKKHHDLLFEIVKDWSAIIATQSELPAETRDAGLILLFLLNDHIDVENRHDNTADRAIEILSELAGGIQPELTKILTEKSEEDDDDDDHDDDDEYDSILYSEKLKGKLILLALNGPRSVQIAKCLPDNIFQLARKHWLLITEKVHYPETDERRFLTSISRRRSTDFNYHFGLKKEHRLDYSPASALQTPLLSLLKFHPIKTVEFIIELTNWATENYRLSEFSKDEEGEFVTLNMPDGTAIRQYGDAYLWSVFRSPQRVAPNVLKSALMALERYLFDLFNQGGEAVNTANELISLLYKKSTSVAITAVIASVCQAFPGLVGNHLLPLLSARKLISWDVYRYSRDRIQSHFRLFEPYYDDERVESDKLPHRKRYDGGLRGFFPLYCYEHGTFKEQVFQIIDDHRKVAAIDDWQWRKILDEMDLRTWRITKRIETEESFSFQIEPTYDESIKEYVEELKQERDRIIENNDFESWLWKVRQKEIVPQYEDWLNIYQHYQQLEEFNFLHHQPGQLAAVGLTAFWEKLNASQKRWCLEMTVKIVNDKIRQAYDPYNMSFETSAFDYESALNTFPILLGYNDLPERFDYELLALRFLTTSFPENDPDCSHFFTSIGINLWSNNENLAIKLTGGLVQFAAFQTTSRFPASGNYHDVHQRKYSEKYEAFLKEGISAGYVIDTKTLNFKTHSIFYTSRALRLLPVETSSPIPFELASKGLRLYLPLLIQDRWERKDEEHSEFAHFLSIVLRDRISKLILWNNHAHSKQLFIDLLSTGQREVKELSTNAPHQMPDVYRFFQRAIEDIILEADRNLPQDDAIATQRTSQQFLTTWRTFAQYMTEPDRLLLFADLLLLDISAKWRNNATSWKPLEEDIRFYETIMRYFGPFRVDSTIELLAHIGDETLLKTNLQWLFTVLRNPKLTPNLSKYRSLDQLIGRIYQNHLNQILNDHALYENFMWLLNNMIEQQSSDAYWIREFIYGLKDNN